MIFIYITLLFGILSHHTTIARKSDTFPDMAKFKKHYDLDHIVKTCYERSGADKNELYEFETTTDLQNIPNSHALKVYLRCFAEVSGSMEVKSNKMILTKFLDYWEDLKQAEQEIYLNMGKGCLKRVKSVTDRLEFSYTLLVCAKQNDNEHFHIFY